MGYNTSVLVLNDCLHDIANDPEFGKNLSDACAAVWRGKAPVAVSAGPSYGAASVIRSHHSTEYSALLFGGNTARNISNNAWLRDGQTDLEVLQAIADKLGFELVEKTKK